MTAALARTASKSQILVGLAAASVEYAFADRAAALLSRGDGSAEDCWRSWAGWRWGQRWNCRNAECAAARKCVGVAALAEGADALKRLTAARRDAIVYCCWLGGVDGRECNLSGGGRRWKAGGGLRRIGTVARVRSPRPERRGRGRVGRPTDVTADLHGPVPASHLHLHLTPYCPSSPVPCISHSASVSAMPPIENTVGRQRARC
jgi:hypothetical protein